jgi:hypothetical protein
MKTLLLAYPLLVVAAAAPQEIDRACFPNYCDSLVKDGGAVRYVSVGRSLVVGRYLEQYEVFVPKTEAPILARRSPQGWRVIGSVYLDHVEGEVRLRLRFFGPDGLLRGQDETAVHVGDAELGRLFGDNSEVFAVTSDWEHSYNVETKMWLLPQLGSPQTLLSMSGTQGRFVTGGPNGPGVWINRETYDGENAETKGFVSEFWRWDSGRKTLTKKEK